MVKSITVFYQVVVDKFFVVYVYDGTEVGFVKEEKIFNSCDVMVDYYRDKFGKSCSVKFSLII